MDTHVRTIRLLGEEALAKLRSSHVCIVGIGGVGGMAAEALARAGIGRITLIDGDVVEKSNINRQIVALESTIGQNKAEIMKERIQDMHEGTIVYAVPEMIADAHMPIPDCDFIVDAIDRVSAKIALIAYAKEKGIPIISSMGTGNRLRPDAFVICPIEKTKIDPLARIMRKELKSRGLSVMTVCSLEEPVEGLGREPASIAFVPPAAGLLLAKHVVTTLGRDIR